MNKSVKLPPRRNSSFESQLDKKIQTTIYLTRPIKKTIIDFTHDHGGSTNSVLIAGARLMISLHNTLLNDPNYKPPAKDNGDYIIEFLHNKMGC